VAEVVLVIPLVLELLVLMQVVVMAQ